jgi:hypothetical protein
MLTVGQLRTLRNVRYSSAYESAPSLAFEGKKVFRLPVDKANHAI